MLGRSIVISDSTVFLWLHISCGQRPLASSADTQETGQKIMQCLLSLVRLRTICHTAAREQAVTIVSFKAHTQISSVPCPLASYSGREETMLMFRSELVNAPDCSLNVYTVIENELSTFVWQQNSKRSWRYAPENIQYEHLTGSVMRRILVSRHKIRRDTSLQTAFYTKSPYWR